MSEKSHPVGGIDYPRTMQEFDEWFPNEVACIEYLRRLRWPEGFQCPNCGKNKAWLTGRVLLRCASCQRQTSVIAGTLFEGTRKPLRTWFQAMWYITSQKYGGNALGLKRVVGFGSYQTAWAWLHKMRHAMVRPGRDRLRGKVEVDETYVGGAETGVRGRETEKKAIVVVAIEIHEPFGFGRVRLRQVPDVSGASLVPFVCEMIEPGSEVLTDGWGGYNALEEHNYIHSKAILSSSGDPAHVLMPGVHRIAALLKRWLLGTYQGSVSSKYLDYYLDEYTFRFNRRSAKARGLLFYRLIEQAVQVEHISRNQIILGEQIIDHNI
ncbi:MAG TPA: IS1595 family transposase [Methylococcaceae bacterium]|nr:IS1595 family transposase [Methylococcaceae bacterium]